MEGQTVLAASFKVQQNARGITYDGSIFRTFEIIIFCFAIAIFDLVHGVEAILALC